jgi:UDP-N-acetylmuramate: L-alanyl-gamma-D-glutamyl-meso-diaminopimelate ligase
MRIHIIGVATTFMTGIAVLAREAGHEVSASDTCINGLTRRTLEPLGVKLYDGFHVENVAYHPDLVIVGKEIESTNQELVAAKRVTVSIMYGSEWLEKYILSEKEPEKAIPSYKKPKPHNPHIHEQKIKHAPKIPLDSLSKTKQVTQ